MVYFVLMCHKKLLTHSLSCYECLQQAAVALWYWWDRTESRDLRYTFLKADICWRFCPAWRMGFCLADNLTPRCGHNEIKVSCSERGRIISWWLISHGETSIVPHGKIVFEINIGTNKLNLWSGIIWPAWYNGNIVCCVNKVTLHWARYCSSNSKKLT